MLRFFASAVRTCKMQTAALARIGPRVSAPKPGQGTVLRSPLPGRSPAFRTHTSAHQPEKQGLGQHLRRVSAKASSPSDPASVPSGPRNPLLQRVSDFAVQHPLASAAIAFGVAALVGLMAAPAMAVPGTSVSIGESVLYHVHTDTHASMLLGQLCRHWLPV